MSLSNATELNLNSLIYNATAWAGVADNAASSPLTVIPTALHTAWPGEDGDQTSNESAYTGYARVSPARTVGGWGCTANSVSPIANIVFPQATGAHETIYYYSTGKEASGASEIFHIGIIGSLQGIFTSAADDNITIPGHTLVVDDRVAFFSAFGSTLSTNMVEGTVYWVKTVSSDVITIAATQGGTTINLTTVGRGVAFKSTPINTAATTTPILSTSTTQKVD